MLTLTNGNTALVAATKIHFEEQALAAGTKQSRQADEAVRLACFVLCLLQALFKWFFTN
jgi:hypothetical protein